MYLFYRFELRRFPEMKVHFCLSRDSFCFPRLDTFTNIQTLLFKSFPLIFEWRFQDLDLNLMEIRLPQDKSKQ